MTGTPLQNNLEVSPLPLRPSFGNGVSLYNNNNNNNNSTKRAGISHAYGNLQTIVTG